MSNQRYALWVDAYGITRPTLPLADNSTASAAIQTALLAKSNAIVASYSEGTLTVTGASPATGIFQSVRDAAILSFLCADGTIAKLTLPAPLQSIFLSDEETVDSTQIAGIITACLSHLTSASGSLASSFIGGIRT